MNGMYSSMLKMIIAIALLSLIAGCAGFSIEPLAFRDQSVDLVWPPFPNKPRIRFLREITGPDKIISQPGKVQRMWEIVTGENKLKLDFVTPYGVATDGGSTVYVADTFGGMVHRYDLARRDVTYIFRAGEELLSSPVGVAVDTEGKLYVSDSVNAKVYIFTKDGDFLGELGDGTVKFQRPAGIAVNSRGDKFIVDVLAHKLKVVDSGNRYKGDFPKEGSGEALNLPSNVAIDRNDNVYVTDTMNFTVKVYDRDGNFKRTIGHIGDAPGSFARPRGIAVDSDEHLYIVDAIFDNFQIFDGEGKLLLFIGKNGKGPGEFFLPSGIFIDRNDRIFVSDTYNRRIQIFQYLKEGVK